MAKESFYCQCRLQKPLSQVTSSGWVPHMEMTSWIPEKYAEDEKVLKIKVDGEWEDGWVVVDVYSRKTEKEVLDFERDYLKQRSVSDA